MKHMKIEFVDAPAKTRKTSSNKTKGAKLGLIAIAIGLIALVVSQGVNLDKEERANQDNQ